jgi:hypothetical protein
MTTFLIVAAVVFGGIVGVVITLALASYAISYAVMRGLGW